MLKYSGGEGNFGKNIKISKFLLDFRASLVVSSSASKGVAFRGCGRRCWRAGISTVEKTGKVQIRKKALAMMNRVVRAVFAAALVLPTALTVSADEGGLSIENPVWKTDAPDPTVWQAGDRYYAASTHGLDILESRDLVHWAWKT